MLFERKHRRGLGFNVSLCGLVLLAGCDKVLHAIHRWQLQTSVVAESAGFRELTLLTDAIAQMSRGRLLITPYPSGEWVRGPDIFRAIS